LASCQKCIHAARGKIKESDRESVGGVRVSCRC
jgi:hypothetical protein